MLTRCEILDDVHKKFKNKSPRLSGESRGYVSQQAWQSGEVQERGVPLLVGVECDSFAREPAFDFVFLILVAYVAVNVDSTTGAGTIKCIILCLWRGRIAETNVCEVEAIRERTSVNGTYLAHDDGLQFRALIECTQPDGVHIAHGDSLQLLELTERIVADGIHIAHFYIF